LQNTHTCTCYRNLEHNNNNNNNNNNKAKAQSSVLDDAGGLHRIRVSIYINKRSQVRRSLSIVELQILVRQSGRSERERDAQLLTAGDTCVTTGDTEAEKQTPWRRAVKEQQE
jgi:hypothetical protein